MMVNIYLMRQNRLAKIQTILIIQNRMSFWLVQRGDKHSGCTDSLGRIHRSVINHHKLLRMGGVITSQDNVLSFSQIITLPSLSNAFQILISFRLTANFNFTIKADLLKDGEFFRFPNRERMNHALFVINQINPQQRIFYLSIHPMKHTFIFLYSCKLAHDFQQPKKVSQFCLSMVTKMKQAILQHVYYILYIGGEICISLYSIVEPNQDMVRRVLQSKKKARQMVNDIILFKRQDKYLMHNESIKQFISEQSTPKTVDETGYNSLIKEGEKLTQGNKMSKGDGINHKLLGYEQYLYQEPYRPKNACDKQKISILSDIQFFEKQRPVYLYRTTKEAEIYKGVIHFTFRQRDGSRGPKIERQMIYKRSVNEDTSSINDEQKIIRHLGDKTSCYLSKYYRVEEKKYQNVIMMDFEQTSVSNYLLHNQNTITKTTKLEILIQTIQGLRFLRDSGVIHMDMKYQNLLVGKDLNIKISDFGESSIIGSSRRTKERCSYPYIPPEALIRQNRIGPGISNHYDTYAFGIMLDFMISNKYILDPRQWVLKHVLKKGAHPNAMILNIHKYLRVFDEDIAQLLILMVVLCLHPNPSKRPSQDVICIVLSVIQEAEKGAFICQYL